MEKVLVSNGTKQQFEDIFKDLQDYTYLDFYRRFNQLIGTYGIVEEVVNGILPTTSTAFKASLITGNTQVQIEAGFAITHASAKGIKYIRLESPQVVNLTTPNAGSTTYAIWATSVQQATNPIPVINGFLYDGSGNSGTANSREHEITSFSFTTNLSGTAVSEGVKICEVTINSSGNLSALTDKRLTNILKFKDMNVNDDNVVKKDRDSVLGGIAGGEHPNPQGHGPNGDLVHSGINTPIQGINFKIWGNQQGNYFEWDNDGGTNSDGRLNIHGQIAVDAPDVARNPANLWLNDKANGTSYVQFTNSGTNYTSGITNVNANDGFVVGQIGGRSRVVTQEAGENMQIGGASDVYEDHGYTIAKTATTDGSYQRGYLATVSSPTSIATATWRKNLSSTSITIGPEGSSNWPEHSWGYNDPNFWWISKYNSDAEGARAHLWSWAGSKSSEGNDGGGHFQARMEISHVGTGNDEKARIKFSTNMGTTLKEALVIKPGSDPSNPSVHIGNESSWQDHMLSVANETDATKTLVHFKNVSTTGTADRVLNVRSTQPLVSQVAKFSSSGNTDDGIVQILSEGSTSVHHNVLHVKSINASTSKRINLLLETDKTVGNFQDRLIAAKNGDGYIWSLDATGHMRITPGGDNDLVNSTTNALRGALSLRESANNVPALQIEHTSIFATMQLKNNADQGGEASSYLGRRDSTSNGAQPITFLGSHTGTNNQNINITNSGFLGVGTTNPVTTLDVRRPVAGRQITVGYGTGHDPSAGDYTKIGNNSAGSFSIEVDKQGGWLSLVGDGSVFATRNYNNDNSLTRTHINQNGHYVLSTNTHGNRAIRTYGIGQDSSWHKDTTTSGAHAPTNWSNEPDAAVHLAAPGAGRASFSQKVHGNYPIFKIETDTTGTVLNTGTEGNTAGTRDIRIAVGNESAVRIKDSVSLANGVTESQTYIGKDSLYSNAAFKLQVNTDSPAVARFRSNYTHGSFGDAAFIEIAGASSAADRRYLGIHGSSNTFYISPQTYWDLGASISEANGMFINASGIMGINNPSPGAGLDIRDEVYPSIWLGHTHANDNLSKIYRDTANGSLWIDNATRNGATNYGHINLRSALGTYVHMDGGGTAFAVKGANDSGSNIFRVSTSQYDGTHGIFMGAHTSADNEAYVHVQETGNDTNVLIRRKDSPGIELISQAAMSTIKTASSAANANSDLTINVGGNNFAYFDASQGGIRLGGGSSNSTPVPGNTVQISGILDVMSSAKIGSNIEIGRNGSGADALFWGNGGASDNLYWDADGSSSGGGILTLGSGSALKLTGTSPSTGDCEWISESGVLRVGRELLLKDKLNDSTGSDVNYGKLSFGDIGGFEFGEATVNGNLLQSVIWARGRNWQFIDPGTNYTTLSLVCEQNNDVGAGLRPKLSIGHHNAGSNKSAVGVYQPNPNAKSEINFNNTATGLGQSVYRGGTIGLGANTKHLQLQNYESGKSIQFIADEIISSGIHRHLESAVVYNGSATAPALQIRNNNQDIRGGLMSLSKDGDSGFTSVTNNKAQGWFVSSSGSVSLGAGADVNGSGTTPKPRYTVDVWGGHGLGIKTAGTLNNGSAYNTGKIWLGDAGSISYEETSNDPNGDYHSSLVTRADQQRWYSDSGAAPLLQLGRWNNDDNRPLFYLGTYFASPATMRIHNNYDMSNGSQPFDTMGDSVLHFSNRATNTGNSPIGYSSGSIIGIKGSKNLSSWNKDLFIENIESNSDIHLVAPSEVRVSGILNAKVTKGSAAGLKVNSANVEIENVLRLTDSSYGSHDITIEQNPQFEKVLAVGGKRLLLEPDPPTEPKNLRIWDISPNPNSQATESYVQFKWNWADVEGSNSGGSNFLSTAGGPQTDPGGSPSTISGMYMYFTKSSSGRKYKIEGYTFSSAGVATYALGKEKTTGLSYPQTGDDATSVDPARIIDNADKYVFKSVEDFSSGGNTTLTVDQVNELTPEFVDNPNYRVKLELGKKYYITLMAFAGLSKTQEVVMLSGTYDPDQAGSQSAVNYTTNFENKLPNLTELSPTSNHLALEATAFGFNATIAGWNNAPIEDEAHEFEIGWTTKGTFDWADTQTQSVKTTNRFHSVSSNAPALYQVGVRPLQNKQVVGTSVQKSIVAGGGGIAPTDQVVAQSDITVVVTSGVITGDTGTDLWTTTLGNGAFSSIDYGPGDLGGEDIIISGTSPYNGYINYNNPA